MFVFSAFSTARVWLLAFLGLGGCLFVAHIGKCKVLARGRQTNNGLFDVLLHVESFAFGHNFTLKRGVECSQVAKLYDVAVRHNVFGNFRSIVQYGLYFLTVERGGLCHTVAKIAEVYTMSARRMGYLNDFSCMRTNVHFSFHKNEL